MMYLTALIMAGGKGSRIRGLGEKPLVKVGGLELLKRVVNTLRMTRSISRLVVATSRYTPVTAELAFALGLDVIQTPGAGYVEDARHAIREFRLGHTLVINSDLPFLRASVIDETVREYLKLGKPTLTVLVPAEKLENLGFEARHVTEVSGRRLAAAGLNIIDGGRLGEEELENSSLIAEDVFCFVNVNTPEEVMRSEQLLEEITRQKQG